MTFRSKQVTAWNKTRAETGYRSGLEVTLAALLDKVSTFFKEILYERVRVPFQVVTHNHYTPDWVLLPQHILIEAKGQFSSSDRTKMLHVKRAHPDLDIRMVFQNPNAKLSKKSASTYASWSDKHGFPWCAAANFPPQAWLDHKPTPASRKALAAFLPQGPRN